MVRPPCCDKLNLKRGLWTAEEDAKILAYVSKHGIGNWTALPKKAGLRRCGKSCRLRWTNYLRPDLKHDSFTPQEEELIVRLHAAIGSRWSIIAQQLPGRTDNDVKNYWNTKLKKKLSEMGIDPVTHKPFSQILADYGNIGCIPNYGSRIGSLTRDLKNAFISKPESSSSPSEVNPNTNGHLATGLMSPKVEPTEEYCLHINDATTNPNSSFDLYNQLQAIKLVTEANYESSPSSSSSTCSTAAQENPALNFNWRDFLLEDEFLPGDHGHHHLQGEEPMNGSTSQARHETQKEQNNEVTNGRCDQDGDEGADLAIPSTSPQVPSTSDSSFVEAMLNQENENFLHFPDLLDEQFSY